MVADVHKVDSAARPSDELLGIPETWRASSVTERLAMLRAASVDLSPAIPVDEAIANRLARWRDQRTLDDQRGLHDPTVIYGCSEQELHRVIDPDGYRQLMHALPLWASELNEAWTNGTREHAFAIGALRERSQPFVALVRPLIVYAYAEVEAYARGLFDDSNVVPFSPDKIVETLLPTLLARLEPLVARTAVLEMHAAKLNGSLTGETSEARFRTFVERLADPSAAEAILRQYPVLARLAFTMANDWISCSRDLLRALTADWGELCELFGFLASDKLVETLVTGDYHRGGRAVLALRFSSGGRLVYKPRSVAVEAQFQRLARWLSSQPGVPALRELKVLSMNDHGWVEFVLPEPCSLDDARDLYRRHGGTLALLHVLAAADCHFQNIITAGADPIVVDLEAVFHTFPPTDTTHFGPAEMAIAETTASSVLSTGLLPMRRWSNASARSVDISGLGARADEWAQARGPVWDKEGTDEMRERIQERVGSASPAGTERRDDEKDLLFDYLDEIVRGFEVTYRALRAGRDELLALIRDFDRLETRSIIRPTGHYTFMLQSSTHPSFLGDAVHLDRRFDRLLASDDGGAPTLSLVGAERDDLWRMDVPIFRTHPGSTDIWRSDGRPIPDFLAESGLSNAIRRIEDLSETNLRQQLWLIRLSLAAWALNRSEADETGEKAPLPLSPERSLNAIETADLLATRLEELAIRRDGEANWIGMQYRPADDSWAVDAVTPNLFDGIAGILLFLAYVAEATDGARHRELAREALLTFERQLDRAEVALTAAQPGGFSGIGGWIYALTHVGALWANDRLLQRARDLVPLLRRSLETATTVDVIGGAAGSIRPLLSLYDLTASDEALDAAIACGECILAAARPQISGAGWLSPAGVLPLTGFAHGAAGISWALLKLYEATGDRRYLSGAAQGIAYERSLFSAHQGNWLDLRRPQATESPDSATCVYYWCHGSAGIGLARLDALSVQSDDQTRLEIEAAVKATAARGFRADHSLCHGYGSAAELMMRAAMAGIPTTDPEGSSWVDGMLESIRLHGFVTGSPLGIEIPGLMMGIAGIGYGLLRLDRPQVIPSVLLLEPPWASNSTLAASRDAEAHHVAP